MDDADAEVLLAVDVKYWLLVHVECVPVESIGYVLLTDVERMLLLEV